MAVFKVRVTKRPEITPPKFLKADLEPLAGEMISLISRRISNATNVLDQSAKPLSKKYARRKERKGLQPIRDWRFTGIMMRSLGLQELRDGSVTVGFNWKDQGSPQFKKAAYGQYQHPMFGLSPRNQTDLQPKIDKVFTERVIPRMTGK